MYEPGSFARTGAAKIGEYVDQYAPFSGTGSSSSTTRPPTAAAVAAPPVHPAPLRGQLQLLGPRGLPITTRLLYVKDSTWVLVQCWVMEADVLRTARRLTSAGFA